MDFLIMGEVLTDSVKEINGTVEKITYRNEMSGYTVAEVRSGRESVTVVGSMPFLAEGDAADRDDIIFLEELPVFVK